MKLNLKEEIKSLRDQPVKFEDSDQTLGSLCYHALSAQFQSEGIIDYKKKLLRYALAEKIIKIENSESGIGEFSNAEVAEMLYVTGLMWPVLVFGEINKRLDPKAPEDVAVE